MNVVLFVSFCELVGNLESLLSLLYGLLEKKVYNAKAFRALALHSFFDLTNHMLRSDISGAKIHSKLSLYPDRKVLRTLFPKILFSLIPFLPHII